MPPTRRSSRDWPHGLAVQIIRLSDVAAGRNNDDLRALEVGRREQHITLRVIGEAGDAGIDLAELHRRNDVLEVHRDPLDLNIIFLGEDVGDGLGGLDIKAGQRAVIGIILIGRVIGAGGDDQRMLLVELIGKGFRGLLATGNEGQQHESRDRKGEYFFHLSFLHMHFIRVLDEYLCFICYIMHQICRFVKGGSVHFSEIRRFGEKTRAPAPYSCTECTRKRGLSAEQAAMVSPLAVCKPKA